MEEIIFWAFSVVIIRDLVWVSFSNYGEVLEHDLISDQQTLI
jgi:hypothetical protein